MVRQLNSFLPLVLLITIIADVDESAGVNLKDVETAYDGIKVFHDFYKQFAPLLGIALKELPVFIPVVGPYIDSGLKLAGFYDKLDNYLNPAENKDFQKLHLHLQKIDEQINDVDGRVGNLVYAIPSEVARNNRLDALKSIMGEIQSKYDRFKNFISLDPSVDSSTKIQLLEDFVKEQPLISDLIQRQLKNIHTQLKDTSGTVSSNVFENLLSSIENNTILCGRQHSASVEVNGIYRDTVTAFFRVMELSSLDCKVNAKAKTGAELERHYIKCKLDLKTILNYLRDISVEVKKALEQSSRDYWKCKTSTAENRIQLGPIFQTYFIEETGAQKGNFISRFAPGLGGCEDVEYDLCTSVICRHKNHRLCSGRLRNCKNSQDLSICLNNEKDSRRYVYVENKDSNSIWGSKEECEVQESSLNNFWLFGKDEVCTCTCDDEFNAELDRYFNLQDVISDSESNMVVTGVKLIKHRRLIHIQIQQGQLEANGNINQSTVAWKPIRKYNLFNKNAVMGKDYFKVTWDNRTVNLDHLEVPTDQIITGVRFKQDGHSLKLEIRHTNFNFTTGKVDPIQSKWYSKPTKINNKKRTKVTVDPGVPQNEQGRAYKVYVNYSNLNFTTSDNEKDIGSHVVPYLDSMEVKQGIPTPLSGISLIHRQYQGSYGILGLKITSYDFHNHFIVEGASWPDKYSDHLLSVIKSEARSS